MHHISSLKQGVTLIPIAKQPISQLTVQLDCISRLTVVSCEAKEEVESNTPDGLETHSCVYFTGMRALTNKNGSQAILEAIPIIIPALNGFLDMHLPYENSLCTVYYLCHTIKLRNNKCIHRYQALSYQASFHILH